MTEKGTITLKTWWARVLLGTGLALVIKGSLQAQQGGALEPTDKVIAYLSSEGLADPVTELQNSLKSGKESLQYEPDHGYLLALLKRLNVPVSSQVLVFSKTSNQAHFTSPKTPRAIYFNDRVFVGWAQGDSVIDIASVDAKKGPIFYAISQAPGGRPEISRQESCMACHISPKTLNVPGILLRSVYTAPDGRAISQVRDFVSGHNNPLSVRWGGWYVTGHHTGDVHLGNATFTAPPANPGSEDQVTPERRAALEKTSNIDNLGALFDTSKYLASTSDSVALLVLDHESRMQNLLTLARYETLYALVDEKTNPEYARTRISHAGEQLLAYMLFRNEAPLNGQVTGTGSFEKEFEKIGPRDRHGRSLRQFDLQSRLFKYPCSYMIYSPSFAALPKEMKEYVWSRLQTILAGQDRSAVYREMSADDRSVVSQILLDTVPDYRKWCSHNPDPLKSSSFLNPR